MIEHHPADPPHGPAGLEVLFPRLYTAEVLLHLLCQFPRLVDAAAALEVLEIQLVEPHAVELPPEPPLKLRVLRCAGFAILQHLCEAVSDLVGVGHVSLVEREMILEQGVAESLHPY